MVGSFLALNSELDGNLNRLIVDVSVIYKKDAETGIQRVVRNVWSELCGCPQNWEVVPIFCGDDADFYKADRDFLTQSANEKAAAKLPFVGRKNDVFLALDFSPSLLPRASRTIAQWKKLGIPVHIVVYDLLPISNPGWFTRRGARNYRKWFNFLERYADQALCISSSVANDLRSNLNRRKWLGLWRRVHPIDIDVIRLGMDFRPRDARAVQPVELVSIFRRPIILMVGTIEPRKDYDFALRVFDKLWSRSATPPVVVIVGKAGWKTRDLQTDLKKHPQFGTSLFWLKNIDDGALAWLYAHSATFFNASRAEGFGLPLVEAMAHNLPVIATDLPVFREFDRGGINFYDMGDVDKALRLLEHSLTEQREAKGKAQIFGASWADTAADIVHKIMS